MITKQQLLNICGDLITQVIPEEVALSFGFSEDPEERFWVFKQNQEPRANADTMLYFSIRNAPWKSQRAGEVSFTKDNKEYVDEMRQIILSIDVYSKINPSGTASDVIRYISAKLQSSFFDEWSYQQSTRFAFEGITNELDLTPLLQTQTWTERVRCDVRLNYRDTTMLSEVYMTRVPESIEDVKNSVNRQLNIKNPYNI